MINWNFFHEKYKVLLTAVLESEFLVLHNMFQHSHDVNGHTY